MKVGFIGAGKMGFTLGKHLMGHKETTVVGYYSKSLASAREAAEFTDTTYYEGLDELVYNADALFLTVPDGQIDVTARRLHELGALTDGKILCHTSGALSSQVFSGISSRTYGYSIHPIYAVNSKLTSYEKFGECFITLEGHPRYLAMWQELFSSLGHPTKIIDAADKVRYHGSAVFASNLVVGLYRMAAELLAECGFDDTEAHRALSALFMNNAENIITYGAKDALTGPVLRCDIETVQKHLAVLDGDKLAVYRAISRTLADLASEKAREQNVCDEQKITDAYERLKSML